MAASRSTNVSLSGELEADTKLNHLVAAQLCKTKMCAMYARGSCSDLTCRFAHSPKELRKAPDLTKTAMCRAFARGQCRVSGCKFAHGEQELRVTPSVYKTQLCNFFEQGYCKKGAECRHAHGVSELRSFQGAQATAQQNAEVSYEPSVEVGTPQRGSSTAGRRSPQGSERHSRTPKAKAPWGAAASPLTPPASQPRQRPSPPEGVSTPERHELRQPAGLLWPGLGLEMPEPMKVRVPELGPHVQQLLRPGPPPVAGGLAGRDSDVAAAALAAARAAREHSAAASAASEVAAKLAAAMTFRRQQGGTPPSRDGLRVLHELARLGVAGPEDYPARAEEGPLPVARVLSFESPPATPTMRLSNKPGSPWRPDARPSSDTWVV